MAIGTMLPPDIRERVEQQHPQLSPQGRVGSAARENIRRDEEPALEAKPEEAPEEELKRCSNPSCREELDSSWYFCAKCGEDLVRGGAAKRLNLEFDETDVQDYLFKGYVVRDLKVLKKHTITVRSSQPKDLKEIDDFIMNGDWMKTKDGKERRISDFYMRQMNSLAITAASLMKMDGQPIGDTLKERMDWLTDRGSALVDLLSQRVVWFNQALTDFMKKEDSVLGS